MDRLLARRWVHFPCFHHVDFQWRHYSIGPPYALQFNRNRAQFYLGDARSSFRPFSDFNFKTPKHRRLDHRRKHRSIFLDQCPVVLGSDDKLVTPLQTLIKSLINVRFPIRQVNPNRSLRSLRHLAQAFGPPLRFSRSFEPLTPVLLALATRGAAPRPALLPGHSHYLHLRTMIQVPGVDSQGEGAVQRQSPTMFIADLAQIRTAPVGGIVQNGGVIDEQVFSGLRAALARALPMRR